MNLLFVSHASSLRGLVDYFEDFLFSQGHQSIKLAHPLDTYDGSESTLFKNGITVRTYERRDIGILNYVYDLYITLRTIRRNKFDVYVGANNFDTLAGIIGRFFPFKSYKVVYFASDYSEERFHNKLLDSVYLLIEKIVLQSADIVVSNTHRAERKRLELGLRKDKSFMIPNSAPIDNPLFPKKNIDKHSFVYVGHVTGEHGLLELITTMRPLMKKLVVIGDGNLWEDLIKLLKRLDLKATLYRAKDHQFVIDYLQKFKGFGLAPYDQKARWTYYCSPLKIYEYIATGIPVITSDRTEISDKIKKDSLGIVYHNGGLRELKSLLLSFDVRNFSQRAQAFYLKYTPDRLYKPVVESLVAKI